MAGVDLGRQRCCDVASALRERLARLWRAGSQGRLTTMLPLRQLAQQSRLRRKVTSLYYISGCSSEEVVARGCWSLLRNARPLRDFSPSMLRDPAHASLFLERYGHNQTSLQQLKQIQILSTLAARNSFPSPAPPAAGAAAATAPHLHRTHHSKRRSLRLRRDPSTVAPGSILLKVHDSRMASCSKIEWERLATRRISDPLDPLTCCPTARPSWAASARGSGSPRPVRCAHTAG